MPKGMGVLQEICCIFSEHLLLKTPSDFSETNTHNIENTNSIFKAILHQCINFEIKKLAKFKELILSKFLIYGVVLLMD